MERRKFIQSSATGLAGSMLFPAIIPGCSFRRESPNGKINIGQIGCGRIARGHDLNETLPYDMARLVACSDVDIKRARDCKELIENWYEENTGKKKYVDLAVYQDYREMPVPPNLDYDLWLGSTPLVYYTEKRVHPQNDYSNGVKFVGTEGWIFAARGPYSVTASDPVSQNGNRKSLDASNPRILESKIGENEIHLHHSEEQHGNWLNSILKREEPVAPAEVGHRSCTACLLGHIAMKLPGKLYWDLEKERFMNNEEANGMLFRPQRKPYDIQI